jgi:hypothetical protein
VVVFFLNMRPAHRDLAWAERAGLQMVSGTVNVTYRRLARLLENQPATSNLAAEVNTMAANYRRLKSVRT